MAYARVSRARRVYSRCYLVCSSTLAVSSYRCRIRVCKDNTRASCCALARSSRVMSSYVLCAAWRSTYTWLFNSSLYCCAVSKEALTLSNSLCCLLYSLSACCTLRSIYYTVCESNSRSCNLASYSCWARLCRSWCNSSVSCNLARCCCALYKSTPVSSRSWTTMLKSLLASRSCCVSYWRCRRSCYSMRRCTGANTADYGSISDTSLKLSVMLLSLLSSSSSSSSLSLLSALVLS